MNHSLMNLCLAVVAMFNTGKVGDYGGLTLLDDGTDGLAYGRLRTWTMNTNRLYDVVKLYLSRTDPDKVVHPKIEAARKLLASMLPILQRTRDYMNQSRALYGDLAFRSAVKYVGENDPVMQSAQDLLFAHTYWKWTVDMAVTTMQFSLPLSTLVVCDGLVHGAWSQVRAQTNAVIPRTLDLVPGSAEEFAAEVAWVKEYLNQRHRWFIGQSDEFFQRCQDRTHALLALAGALRKETFAENWQLRTPITLNMKSPWRDNRVVLTDLDIPGDA